MTQYLHLYKYNPLYLLLKREAAYILFEATRGMCTLEAGLAFAVKRQLMERLCNTEWKKDTSENVLCVKHCETNSLIAVPLM